MPVVPAPLLLLVLSSSSVYDHFPTAPCFLTAVQLHQVQVPLLALFPGAESVEIEFRPHAGEQAHREICSEQTVSVAEEALIKVVVEKAKENMVKYDEQKIKVSTSPPFNELELDGDQQRFPPSTPHTSNEEELEESAANEIEELIAKKDVEGAARIFLSAPRSELFVTNLFADLFDEQWKTFQVGRVYDLAASVRSVAAFEILRRHQETRGLFEQQPLLVALFASRLLEWTRGADFTLAPPEDQSQAYLLARDANAARRRVVSAAVQEVVESEAPSGGALSLLQLIAAPPASNDTQTAPQLLKEAVDVAAPFLRNEKIGVAKFAEMFARREDTICLVLEQIKRAIDPEPKYCQTLQLYMATILRLPSVREASTESFYELNCAPLMGNVSAAYVSVRDAPDTDLQQHAACLLQGFKESMQFYLRYKAPTVPTLKYPELQYALQQNDLRLEVRRMYEAGGVTECDLFGAYLSVLDSVGLANSAAALVTAAQAHRRSECARVVAAAPLWTRRLLDASQPCDVENAKTGQRLDDVALWNVTFDELGRPFLSRGPEKTEQLFIEAVPQRDKLHRIFSLGDGDRGGFLGATCNDCPVEQRAELYNWKIECVFDAA
ncbi:uncharacterized protein LOC132200226 [Neocloeon triangulifer]|uniref:uncharacterized protein LOC132200226 n=1 Tax=Neocloeon triangulifer TaxID=2078957 RepID=UPI00286F30C1|nr:uncharacterized protein LOC132200226 [Neocloeon triangulifer]XP_059481517.1 uncharacterized protein LOC132200226 [Neocloeon triangulifer]